MKFIIKNNVEKEYIINKSKFIVILRRFDDLNEFENLINAIKEEWKNATHYCYAYILNNHEKCSDDKEPSGTAGLPILNVLKKNKLDNILCVVVRYFGGIKLGSGGLIRAYSNTVSDTINNIKIIEKINYTDLTISFDYSKIKDVEHILEDCIIVNKSFNNNVVYKVKIDENMYNEIRKKLDNVKIKNM